MVYLLTIGLLLLSLPAFPASWYVDKDATGTRTGTSWANAWTNFTDIVWGGAGVVGGDTLYVSGGASGKTYPNGITVGASGAAGPITITVGQDANHDGKVTLRSIDFGAYTNITINGGLDPAYAAPTNLLQLRAMTNNIGFVIDGGNASFAGFYSTKMHFNKIWWVEVKNVATNSNGNGIGLWINFTSAGPQVSNSVRYCWIHDTGGDAIQSIGGTANTAVVNEIAFNIIEWLGDNGFEGSDGWAIHDNIIGPSRWLQGHPDGAQTVGSFFEIYNNRFFDFGSSFLRLQATQTNHQHIWVFNNEFVSGYHDTNLVGELGNTGIEVVQYADGIGEVDLQTWDSIVIANNTYYTTNSAMTGTGITWSKRDEGTSSAFVHNILVTNSLVVNNIFRVVNPQVAVDNGIGISWQTWRTGIPWGEYVHYTQAGNAILDYNVVSATGPGQRKMSYFGTNYVSGEVLGTFWPWTHNTSNAPSFQGHWDFELSAADTVALNRGTNLSSFFNFDILNRARNVGGSWDIGAYERQESNLVVYLNFDSDTAGGNATDSSGNGFTGYRFTLSEDSYPSNRTVSAIGGTTLRPNATGNAVEFLWGTNNSYGLYLRDGPFFGVTNAFNALSNMSQFTVMCWARYNAATRSDLDGADYSADGNANLVSGGSTANATPGSWFLGRYNQDIWLNNTRFVLQTNSSATGSWGAGSDRTFGDAGKVVFNFPDRGYDNAGDTTNWHHYAFTFSNGVGIAYFDGVAYATNDMSANVTTMRLGGSASRGYDWVGIGVNPHVGTPQFEDETGNDYPNNGFMNGGIDQVRIYSRTLTWQEIVDIANSEGAEFADAPAGGEEGGGTPATRTKPLFFRLRP